MINFYKFVTNTNSKVIDYFIVFLVAIIPLLIAMTFMNIWQWDFSIPLVYLERNGDETWQLVLSKMLIDTGWVLNNPFLGAPDIAHWHNNPAAQTSGLHSILMLGLSKLIGNPIEVQQIYYVINFSLISLTSYWSSRLLGLSRYPAFCVALLFSLFSYRFNYIIYAFLSNYFIVPLAIVVIFWVMMGEFSKPTSNEIKQNKIGWMEIFSSKKFLLGLGFVILITLSDGYYAFFTLLLLGFATFIRLCSGDIKRPASFLVPSVYIATLVIVAFVISLPLTSYKKNNPEEFSPNGITDPVMIRHAFEAEVYSSSLKLLISPAANHRVDSLAKLGEKILMTSEASRQYKFGAHSISLGALGSIIFIIALVFAIIPKPNYFSNANNDLMQENGLIKSAIALSIFIFLCSIAGGIGTLIALIYPTIRAYDRFPLFLLFVLYVGAGAVFTRALINNVGKNKSILIGISSFILFIGIYDQIPQDSAKGSIEVKNRFLAEKSFVKEIESKLPLNAMVYQYPYSQYLTDNKYYGWGSFAHVRLYLHSKTLRWSNGASKNSAVESWHLHLSHLPLINMFNELQAAGFSGLVIDKRVVPDIEYSKVKNIINLLGMDITEDAKSKLAFAKFKQAVIRVEYDKDYKNIDTLIINNRALIDNSKLPELINELALNHYLDTMPKDQIYLIIKRSDQPQIFLNRNVLTLGTGESPISPLSNMVGDVSCAVTSNKSYANLSDKVTITIKNNSNFDWHFDSGSFPIRIGIHLKDNDDKLIRWDDSLRVPVKNIAGLNSEYMSDDIESGSNLKNGSMGQIIFPLSKLNLSGITNEKLIADFQLVQDGHAWFEHLGCKVRFEK